MSQPTTAAGPPGSRDDATARRRTGKGGQAGDGRELALLKHVLMTAPRADPDAVIAAIDEFAYQTAFLMNVGDVKGALLEQAVRHNQPRQLMELGTYCGYSALRIVRAMPAHAHLYSLEPDRVHARIATRIWRHAGVADRVTCLVGRLDDEGITLSRLRDRHGLGPGSLDFLFLDHDKHRYLPDLQQLLRAGWLHPGSVVVADNVLTPGAPDYRAYMRAHDATLWTTTEHATELEYRPNIPDLVLISRYRGER